MKMFGRVKPESAVRLALVIGVLAMLTGQALDVSTLRFIGGVILASVFVPALILTPVLLFLRWRKPKGTDEDHTDRRGGP